MNAARRLIAEASARVALLYSVLSSQAVLVVETTTGMSLISQNPGEMRPHCCQKLSLSHSLGAIVVGEVSLAWSTKQQPAALVAYC